MEHFPTKDRLHSDVLEEKYGPISVKVLIHDDAIRKAHLIDKTGISRTFAITFLNTPDNEEIKQVNELIKPGEAIGKAFREFNYLIRKNVIDVYTIHLPVWLQEAFKIQSEYAKARLSEFYAKKEGTPVIIYGTVVEIYHPDVRSPVLNDTDLAQINPSTAAFESVGVLKEEIWNEIGQGNKWKDNKDYEKAKNLSLSLVFSLKKKIEEELIYQ